MAADEARVLTNPDGIDCDADEMMYVAEIQADLGQWQTVCRLTAGLMYRLQP